VTDGHPAVLRSRDGHSRWLNSAAIARAGITRDTAVPEGGAIFRDDRGEATGVLQENANALAAKAIRTCGGQSMLKSLPLERLYRDSRCGSLMLPWTAELCLDRIGREALYEPGESDD